MPPPTMDDSAAATGHHAGMSQSDRPDTLPGDLVTSDREVFANHMALIASMTREFSSSRDSQAVSRHGLERITTFLGAEASSLFLLSDDGRDLHCAACFGPVDVTGMRVPLGQGIVGRAVKRNKTQMVRDARHDPDFGGQDIAEETGFVTRSVLVAPLSLGSERLGAIEIINKAGGDGLFDEHDQTLLEVLAGSAALAIDNFRLTQRLVEQERARHELTLAAEIQRSLLPRPANDAYPVHGINAAARMVSGDFFDIVDCGEEAGRPGTGRIWFAIGDVSGKGMNAAILMTKTASLFRCLCKTVDNPGRLLASINAELCETGSHGMFVTMIAGYLDRETGNVVLANAGHEPPLIVPADGGAMDAVPAEAPPLGIAADIVGPEGYPEHPLHLGDGSLYVFTDGLTEAYTAAEGDAVLGSEGARRLIRHVAALPAADRLREILARVTVPGRPLRDDVTVLLVQGSAAP
ncbi:PP2C family protein-serine/threonine phosphatase [Caenispirillum salinarum]|uniref:PP2C family protein-serine/threonine phosphatase n=1 Tax=Caenispirillum salinarum TaxID=859058 RepID=UPI00384E6497